MIFNLLLLLYCYSKCKYRKKQYLYVCSLLAQKLFHRFWWFSKIVLTEIIIDDSRLNHVRKYTKFYIKSAAGGIGWIISQIEVYQCRFFSELRFINRDTAPYFMFINFCRVEWDILLILLLLYIPSRYLFEFVIVHINRNFANYYCIIS